MIELDGVKITERGWPGHYICARSCGFRRNTLLEYGDKKWVVSTVGAYRNSDGKMDAIGYNRWYETMVFEAQLIDGYIDADVARPIYVDDCDWGIWGKTWQEIKDSTGNTPDNAANDMHDRTVRETIKKLKELKDDNNND